MTVPRSKRLNAGTNATLSSTAGSITMAAGSTVTANGTQVNLT